MSFTLKNEYTDNNVSNRHVFRYKLYSHIKLELIVNMQTKEIVKQDLPLKKKKVNKLNLVVLYFLQHNFIILRTHQCSVVTMVSLYTSTHTSGPLKTVCLGPHDHM